MTDTPPAPAEPQPPAYRVQTSRLILRCWQPNDAAALKAAIDASLPELQQRMIWALKEPTGLQEKLDYTRRARAQFDLGTGYYYGIWSADEQTVLGGTGFHVHAPDWLEIGYWIRSDQTGQGIATEATRAQVKLAFEVHCADRLELRISPDNVASIRIAEKCGFRREGVLRRAGPQMPGQARSDSEIWSMLPEDQPGGPGDPDRIRAWDALGRVLL